MHKYKNFIKYVVIIIIASVVFECFGGNYRFWESLFFSRSTDHTVEQTADGIVIRNINDNVYNIHIDCDTGGYALPLQISLSDEANSDLILSSTQIISDVPESGYIRIFPDGKVKEIRIDLNTDFSEYVTVELNAVRPFMFNIHRFMIILVIASLIAVFRPKAPIYKTDLFGPGMKLTAVNKTAVISFALFIIILWCSIALSYNDIPISAYYERSHIESIYSLQARAFLDGHTYLNETPPDFLKDMDDPYDSDLREMMERETGEWVKGDFAYYNGHYYCYYGVVPTIMFYLPFMIITGEPLANVFPVMIFSILFIGAAFYLVYELALRFKNVSLGHYLICAAALLFSSFGIYCVQIPWIYSVAFASSLFFACTGIALWLKAERDMTLGSSPKWSVYLTLILGSLSCALTLGCRPSFAIVIFLAFPIFYDCIRNKKFFTLKSLDNTLCVLIPIILVFIPLLIYNYARFDSIFDFGATRNLSVNLSDHRFHLSVIPFGLYEYLFQPMIVKGVFPYIHSTFDWNNWQTDYLGFLFFDPAFGGFFAIAPVNIYVFLIHNRKDHIKNAKLFWLALTSVAFAFILMILDISVAGISMRYIMDFGSLLSVAAVIVLLSLYSDDTLSVGIRRIVSTSSILLLVFTVASLLMISLAYERPNAMIEYSRHWFYSLKYLFFVLR